MNENKSPSSILICCIRVIGDVILSTPLIGILRRAYPDASIDVMVAAGSGDFLRRDPRVRNVIEAPSKETGDKGSKGSSLSTLTSIFMRYDLAISFNASDRGNIAVICAGRKQRISFYVTDDFIKSFWKKALLSTPLLYDTSCHTILLSKLITEALGIKIDRLEVKVFWNEEDDSVVQHFTGGDNPRKQYFVIHPFARWEYKYWDLDSFVSLSDLIAGKYGITPVWTSSPDPEECDWLLKYAEKCSIMPKLIAGTFTLNQMADLITGAALYIGLDTAITHIAASTGVPVVALYGPTETHRWFPWNNSGPLDQMRQCSRGTHRNGNIMLIQKECQHAHCIRPNCPVPCMQRITVEEIFGAAGILLQEIGTSESSANA